jgi:beta-1,4-mannooligosaccharide/beta-1,4-mannosyl-N-acetylglucosamine phosphorylase
MEKIKIIGKEIANIQWQDAKGEQTFWRYDANPIIKRNPIKSGARAFNSGIVPFNGGFAGVFRVDTHDASPRLHTGFSKNGVDWTLNEQDIKWTDENGKPFQPVLPYDPRVIGLDGIYYVCWCTDDCGPSIGLGRTKDFKSFERLPNPFFPYNRNAVLFPRKINGEYYIFSRPSDNGHTAFGNIFVSRSKDLIYWGRHSLIMRSCGAGWWDSLKIGAGPVPIETDKGWLVFYHGVVNNCNGYNYSIGAALLDRDDPSKVLLRGNQALLSSEYDYETTGFVPNVCFPTAALADAGTGRIAVYYGAADTYMALAFTTTDIVYEWLLKNNCR